METLFKAIDDSNIEKVKQVITETPTLISTVATEPEELEGESLLQHAIKSSEIDIANFLIDQGADVNYFGTGTLDKWELPILHVAISGAIQNTRFPRREADGPKNDGVLYQQHFDLLKRILEEGADVHKVDTYGNLPIMRAVLDALNLDLSITDDQLDEDLAEIFKLLVDHGCDVQERTDTRKSVEEMFRNNVVMDYFE